MDSDLDDYLEHKKVVTNTVPTSKNSDYDKLEQVVETYTTEGYSAMTGDRIRNKAYQDGIHAIVETMLLNQTDKKHSIHVTEIGPGGDACLLHMIYKIGLHPKQLKYYGIEGNKKSVKSCFNHVKMLIGDHQKNYQILHALSTDPRTDILKIF
jgi:hypothetical protein